MSSSTLPSPVFPAEQATPQTPLTDEAFDGRHEAHHPLRHGTGRPFATAPLSPADGLQHLLDYLAIQRLIDCSVFNPAMLMRRIRLRMAACGQDDIADYYAYLTAHAEEIDRLLDAITIKVSHFFRNILTFAFLRERILPDLFAAGDENGIRIWCAGCAQGEEAYSLAILLRDYCRKEDVTTPIMIVATDIDREALAWSERGWYRPEALEETRKAYLDRYFIAEGDGYRVVDEIRTMVTFSWHDLACGIAPKAGIFSDYHLILCRNVLIYFKRERAMLVQHQLASKLIPGGWLVLGEAEDLPPTLSGKLHEVMPGTHIFRKEIDNG